MTKINDGSGKPNPSSDIFPLKDELFPDEVDELRGKTIGIEVVRENYKSRLNSEGKDTFDREEKIDIGADAPQDNDPDFDVKKLRRESDTGLTVQLNKIKLGQNIKG